MGTTIALAILILFFLGLFFKYMNLKGSYDYLKKRNRETEKTLSIYFNMLIQYRDIIIKNNLTVPGEFNNTQENSINYSIDSILDEIAEKGIDNVSQDKLDFLRNNNKDVN